MGPAYNIRFMPGCICIWVDILPVKQVKYFIAFSKYILIYKGYCVSTMNYLPSNHEKTTAAIAPAAGY